eukprot:NODE_29_length_3070_cov_256.787488_g25_i0.p1 GENE.NODE_29_length_3070_cov_256.787488_g25_i0~~NODE_29_length_3070_cov_256.787488_g25_i0.p1  ORF type:complete len:554 (+),score=124.93 NODE_29_length_3070_cov_256.787488_g25_i0:1356-3017(+)
MGRTDDPGGVRTAVRASYVVNSEDEEEDRQVRQEAVVAAKGTDETGTIATYTKAFRRLLNTDGPDCIIVDEGHKLSNSRSCVTRALHRVHTQHRIILTGTPIQNNLWEYFTMVNFIRPGYWDRDEFRKLYANVIQTGQASFSTPQQISLMEERSNDLYRELFKFVDRCDVNTLHKELPTKTEFVVHTSLSSLQAKVYMGFVNQSLQSCPSTGKLETKRVLFMSAVLFKIGNHLDLVRQYCVQKGVTPNEIPDQPEGNFDEFAFSQDDRKLRLQSKGGRDFTWAVPLFQRQYQQLVLEHNHKMMALFEIISRCMELNEKVVVFSQWASTLDVIESLLCFLPPPTPSEEQDAAYACTNQSDVYADDGSWTCGRDYFRLDGDATNAKRQTIIDHWNDYNSTSRLLLSCTKAGGLGINLIGATRVVLFDTSWNPQADQQAIYRAYRYGQRKRVYVYRLVNDGTIEDTIFQKVYSKVHLFRQIVDDESLRWKRRDLTSLKHVGLREESSRKQIDAQILGMDSVLRHLNSKGLLCKVEHHSSLFQSEDNEQLTQASQCL